MRLRTTALPSFLVTVKPKRATGGSTAGLTASSRALASIAKDEFETRAPPRTRKKSARRLMVTRCIFCQRGQRRPASCGPLSRQLLAALGAAARQDRPAALGRHARAKTMPVLAHEAAGLEGSFHVTSPVTAPRPSLHTMRERRPGLKGLNSSCSL